MSAPVQDDRDKRAMYVPPWARDEGRDEEARRIHSEIVAAAERLKPPAPPQPKPQRADADLPARIEHDRSGLVAPPSGEPFNVEAMRRGWEQGAEGEAVSLAEPKLRRKGWSTTSRLAGATGLAAVVALFVTGSIPLPMIDISLTRDRKDANAAAPPAAAPAPARQQQAAAPAPPQPAPAPAQQAHSQPRSTVGVAPNSASPFPPPPRPVAAEPAPPKPPSVLPEARVLDFMPREEIDGLIKRSQELLAMGDISGGRLLLTRAAEAGDARASFALASTYDSAVVATLGVVGAFPDLAKARAWYTKAAEQGSSEAARRLEQPHLRQR